MLKARCAIWQFAPDFVFISHRLHSFSERLSEIYVFCIVSSFCNAVLIMLWLYTYFVQSNLLSETVHSGINLIKWIYLTADFLSVTVMQPSYNVCLCAGQANPWWFQNSIFFSISLSYYDPYSINNVSILHQLLFIEGSLRSQFKYRLLLLCIHHF